MRLRFISVKPGRCQYTCAWRVRVRPTNHHRNIYIRFRVFGARDKVPTPQSYNTHRRRCSRMSPAPRRNFRSSSPSFRMRAVSRALSFDTVVSTCFHSLLGTRKVMSLKGLLLRQHLHFPEPRSLHPWTGAGPLEAGSLLFVANTPACPPSIEPRVPSR